MGQQWVTLVSIFGMQVLSFFSRTHSTGLRMFRIIEKLLITKKHKILLLGECFMLFEKQVTSVVNYHIRLKI
jgi:hypothetical protein